MKRLLLLLLCCSLLVFPAVAPVAAQDDGGGGDTGTQVQLPCNIGRGEIHFECIPQYLAQIVAFFFSFVGAIALVEIIWGGYETTLGGAVPGLTEQGKHRIFHALIGLIVSILAFGIISLVLDASAR